MADITGGWGEYQRLVLAELERHNALLTNIDDRIQSLKLEIELIKEHRRSLDDLKNQVKLNTERLGVLEGSESTDLAIRKYRNWIIGLLFLFITALLIPIINLIISGVGSG